MLMLGRNARTDSKRSAGLREAPKGSDRHRSHPPRGSFARGRSSSLSHSRLPETPWQRLAPRRPPVEICARDPRTDRKSTRLNSSHANISYAVFCLKKKKKENQENRQAVTTISEVRKRPQVLPRHT